MVKAHVGKWIKRVLLGVVVLVLVAVLALWWAMRGSLPKLEGNLALTGLSAPVTVERDERGVVTVQAANEADAMRALGYVHAQERYFEMDLLRRVAAGELAGLFGPLAVDVDRKRRMHRLRARVHASLGAIVGDRRATMQAYVDGVNAGLSGLHTRPWPYLLLRQQPEPWRLEDSPLVGYAMYFDLQDGENARELALWRMRPQLPAALFSLLTHDGSHWDAPLTGPVRGDAVLPTAAEVDLRKLPAPKAIVATAEERRIVGSNNFAVGAAATRDGRAIVADDMHLALRAPNLWFRAQLRYPDSKAPGGRVDVGGFTLPGLPFIVVGSNGHVAWAFTNSYIDAMDWAVQRVCGAKAVPGCVPARHYKETIQVAGGDPVTMDVEETDWGPVIDHDAKGNALALRWIAHQPGALNVGVGNLARADSLADAVEISRGIAIPTQNMLIADSSGAIGWRWLGPIPMRAAGCHGEAPIDFTKGQADCPPWPISTSRAPLLTATRGRLWTANNRIAADDVMGLAGDGGTTLGARARQIRDGLFAKPTLEERDLLAIQLDDRALFMQTWWQLLQDQAKQASPGALTALAKATTARPERASADSVSYRIARAWRLAVHARVIDGLTGPARAKLGKDFEIPGLPQQEGVVWPIVNQQPAHLLPPRFKSWAALFEDAAREVQADLEKQGPLDQRTWGEENTARICHPLARALPTLIKSQLCMPFEPLAGDAAMPRVQHPDFGASERMVVSPGHEAEGIIHMPGGQSGHPMSPYWGAGHEDWVQGRPTPFLPGKSQFVLKLRP